MKSMSVGRTESFEQAGVPDAWNALSHDVIGCAVRVHRALGPGLPERIYAAAMEVEFRRAGIPFQQEVAVHVTYEGADVGVVRLDLLVGGLLVVELKATEGVAEQHLAQLVSYLRAANMPLGLLINFNVPLLKQGVHRRLHAPAIAGKLATARTGSGVQVASARVLSSTP